MKFLTEGQVKQVLKDASKQSLRDYLILLTLINSGLRVSELINLTPGNINFEDSFLNIVGKGNKPRVIDIPELLTSQLELFINSSKIKHYRPIFDLTRTQIWNITKEIANINPHALRHTYAIQLLKHAKNIRYVQVQLGHSSLATTQKYLRYMEYKQEKEMLSGLYG